MLHRGGEDSSGPRVLEHVDEWLGLLALEKVDDAHQVAEEAEAGICCTALSASLADALTFPAPTQ